MKYIPVIALFIMILTGCNEAAKNKYTISGTIDKPIEGYVFLQKRVSGVLTSVDSVKPENNAFTFTGTVEFPEVKYINIPETKSLIPFFLEASEITISINTTDINATSIEGSKSQAENEAFLDLQDQYQMKIREDYSFYKKAEEMKDSAKMQLYDSLYEVHEAERIAFIRQFVTENNKSVISPYILYRNSFEFEAAEIETMFNNFDPSISKSEYYAYLEEYIGVLKRVALGQLYVTFMMEDTTRTKVAISSLVGGKYVLLDFWASWCGPCRDENPNLVGIYNDFKDKGFEIVGISLDTNKESWLKAIQDDQLTWTHLSDLKGWENSAARIYGVRAIPANVLLDKDGYIIAKNLKGEDLREKLESIFKSNV
jgi:thiol-disulfide isomerase/thioredoxin